MAGIDGLLKRAKKCQDYLFKANRPRKRSIVYMDRDGVILWEDGVEYNPGGVLAVPLPNSIEEWESCSK